MANQILYPTLKARRFVNFLSRYVNSKVLFYGDNKKTTFAIYKRKPIQATSSDKFMQINSSTEYRPDMVSQMAYGFPDYWWRIMQFNQIYDIKDFRSGITIRIPAIG